MLQATAAYMLVCHVCCQHFVFKLPSWLQCDASRNRFGEHNQQASPLACLSACLPAHAAPEQLMGQRCTLAADMYSFGILLIELTTQQVVSRRGHWRLPHVPKECPKVWAASAGISEIGDVHFALIDCLALSLTHTAIWFPAFCREC